MLLKISLALGVLGCAAAAQNAESISGQWTIGTLPVAGSVELTLHRTTAGSDMSSSSQLAIDQLRNLSAAQINSEGSTVHFQIARDAGTLECDGYFKLGLGGGTFTFAPSGTFVSRMGTLGYTGLDTETIFRMAVHDVSTSWIQELRKLGYDRISADELIRMRIHNVTTDYIRALQKLGYSNLSPDELVTMRIHGVGLDFVEQMKDLGFRPSTDDLVRMCIHGVTVDYVRSMKSLGYDPTIDELVAMRIHGVTSDFAHDLKNLGYAPTIDQLVNLKIHGIVD